MIRRYASTKGMSDTQCRNFAPATADRIAESIAGRARVLWELATGQNPVQDDGGTPLNPQGKLGCDRSGQPWGDCLKHPLLVAGSEHDSNIYSGVNYTGYLLSSGELNRTISREFSLYCRPFSQMEKTPYSRGYVSVGYICNAGTATGTIELLKDGDVVGSQSISASTTLSYNAQGILYFPLSPLQNLISLGIKANSFSGGATSISIVFFAINQIARREHA